MTELSQSAPSPQWVFVPATPHFPAYICTDPDRMHDTEIAVLYGRNADEHAKRIVDAVNASRSETAPIKHDGECRGVWRDHDTFHCDCGSGRMAHCMMYGEERPIDSAPVCVVVPTRDEATTVLDSIQSIAATALATGSRDISDWKDDMARIKREALAEMKRDDERHGE